MKQKKCYQKMPPIYSLLSEERAAHARTFNQCHRIRSYLEQLRDDLTIFLSRLDKDEKEVARALREDGKEMLKPTLGELKP